MDSANGPAAVGKRPVRGWRITVGTILLLAQLGNKFRSLGSAAPQGIGVTHAIGWLIGYPLFVALAVWLIASGLPRSIGSQDLKRTRRRNLVSSGRA